MVTNIFKKIIGQFRKIIFNDKIQRVVLWSRAVLNTGYTILAKLYFSNLSITLLSVVNLRREAILKTPS